MGLPTEKDNGRGYDQARLSTKFGAFRNKTYLLVHGTSDDNVHYQQSMSLSRTLELNDIPFEQIVSAIDSQWNTFLSIDILDNSNIFFRPIPMRIIHCGM